MLIEVLINRPPNITDDEFIAVATKQFVTQLSGELNFSERHVKHHILEEVGKS